MSGRKFFIGPELFTGGGVDPSPVSSFIKDLVAKTMNRAAAAGIEYPHFDMQCTTQANGDIAVTVTCTELAPMRATADINLNSAMVVDPDAVIDR